MICFTSCVKKPKACIQPSDSSPDLGLEVSFVDCSENKEYWGLAFGDGTFINQEHGDVISHTYEIPGPKTCIYTVYSKKRKKEDELIFIINVYEPTITDIEGVWDRYNTSEHWNSWIGTGDEISSVSTAISYDFGTTDVAIGDPSYSESFTLSSKGAFVIGSSTYELIYFHEDEMILRRPNELWYELVHFRR